MFVVGTKACIKIAGVALSELVHPEVGQIESETGDGHYYGNGHVALYKTHANHYLENSDPNDIFLTKPSDLVKTLELIEIIEKSLETNRPGNK